MTKADRKLLRDMLHKLECYYPVINSFMPFGNPTGADAHNAEREATLKAARKLVTKLCRIHKRTKLSGLGEHFV